MFNCGKKVSLCCLLSLAAFIVSCKKKESGSGSEGNTQKVEATDEQTGGTATAEENSLNQDDTIYVEEGVEIATDVTGAYLTLPPGITRAGSPVAVRAGKSDTVILEFITISIPLDAAPADGDFLLAEQRQLALFSKVKKADGQVYLGVQPLSQATINGMSVSFQARNFGIYQAGYLSNRITAAIEKAVDSTIISKKEDENIAPLTWKSLVGSVSAQSIVYTGTYESLSPVSICLVWVTKDLLAGQEVARASVPGATFEFSPTESGTYFAHFSCETSNGKMAPLRETDTGVAFVKLDPLAPVALSFNKTIVEDVGTQITLERDISGLAPDACTVQGQSNVDSYFCTCVAGICKTTIQGVANYYGSAGFDFTLSKSGKISNLAHVSLTISAVDDAPVANNKSIGNVVNGGSVSAVLDYVDPDMDLATTCSISNLTLATQFGNCECSSGSCKVFLLFNAGLGAGGYDFQVTANSVASNTGHATFTVVAAPPSNVDFVRLDLNSGATAATSIRDKILVLPSNNSVDDFDFYLVSDPADTGAVVIENPMMGSPAKDPGNGSDGPLKLTNPVYQRSGSPPVLDYFKYALRNKITQVWLANASPTNPGYAYVCNVSGNLGYNALSDPADVTTLLLCDASQLTNFASNCSGLSSNACIAKFKQVADLDLSTQGSSGADFIIGRELAFVGTYDGNFHKIMNYQISSTFNPAGLFEDVALFGTLGTNAYLRRIRLTNSSVDFTSGTNFTNSGILVGYAGASGIKIEDCSVEDSNAILTEGTTSFGALVGYLSTGAILTRAKVSNVDFVASGTTNAGVGLAFGYAGFSTTVSQVAVDSASSFSVSGAGGTTFIGGLGGKMEATAYLSHSYSRATIDCSSVGSPYMGGLIGYGGGTNYSIIETYSSAVMTSSMGCTPLVGGVVGQDDGFYGTYQRNYFDSTTTAPFAFGAGTSKTGISAQSTAQMQLKATYVGWDFSTIWNDPFGAPPTLRK